MDDRREWLDKKTRGIGASEAPTILGLNPYKSAYRLWGEKVGLIQPDDLSEIESVEWGTILEEPVARKYATVTGRTLQDPGRFTLQTSKKYPWMICTLDRIIEPIDGRGPGALEIKTTGSSHGEEWRDGPPPMPYAQLQHQLIVMDWEWGSLAVLIGGQKFRWIDVERNDAFCRFLIEEEEKFWDLVQREIPPEVDASDSTKEAIKRLYPVDSGETIALPAEIMEWSDRMLCAKQAMKAAQAEIQACENRIKAALKDASVGLFPNGSGFSYKMQHRDAYTVEASDYRVLREIKGRGI